MIKSEELNDPNSCINKAEEDEIVFVLLARDIASPQTIIAWVNERVAQFKNKLSDPEIQEALQTARNMELWRSTHR